MTNSIVKTSLRNLRCEAHLLEQVETLIKDRVIRSHGTPHDGTLAARFGHGWGNNNVGTVSEALGFPVTINNNDEAYWFSCITSSTGASNAYVIRS